MRGDERKGERKSKSFGEDSGEMIGKGKIKKDRRVLERIVGRG